MSQKSVAEKLLIKPGCALWTSEPSVLTIITPLPTGVAITDRLDKASVALLVAQDAASLRELLAREKSCLDGLDVLWVVYRKGNTGDLNRDKLWPIVGEYGMRPITQVAVDDTWSALRFRALKDGEAPFTGARSTS
jgi:hypothetical protein